MTSKWGDFIFITEKEGNSSLFTLETGIGNKPERVVVHQTAVEDCSWEQSLYHYYIEKNPKHDTAGRVEVIRLFSDRLLLPLSDSPILNFISVGVSGLFDDVLSGRDDRNPSLLQVRGLAGLWMCLQEEYSFRGRDLFGHYHLGRSTCPGQELMRWIERIRREDLGRLEVQPIIHVQQILSSLGYMEEDVVCHGRFDRNTRHCLRAFEKDYAGYGLRVDGILDALTAQFLDIAYNHFLVDDPIDKCPIVEDE